MAKFYVHSGDFQLIIQAESARDAALWAMHMAMEEVVPVDDLEWTSAAREDLRFTDDEAKLGMEMLLSEIGFGRDEAGNFETLDVMTEWNQLTVVVARLSELIDQDK